MTEHSNADDAAFSQVWVHRADEIPARGLTVEREATPEQLTSLAAALDVRSFTSLRATYELQARAGGRVRLDGHIEARLVQRCVVTLTPVEASLSEPIRAEFRDSEEPEDDWDSDGAVAAALNRDHEPIRHGMLDVGRVVFEQISAVLDPYPRAPGATFEWTDPRQRRGDEESEDGGGARPDSPFAVLRKLKGEG